MQRSEAKRARAVHGRADVRAGRGHRALSAVRALGRRGAAARARTATRSSGGWRCTAPACARTFTTRNVLTPPREITLDARRRAVSGRSKAAGRSSRSARTAARASTLSIRFEFANPMLSLLLSRSFEKSCDELVDAFVARARAVYGTRLSAMRVWRRLCAARSAGGRRSWRCRESATVAEAVARSGLLQQFPEIGDAAARVRDLRARGR